MSSETGKSGDDEPLAEGVPEYLRPSLEEWLRRTGSTPDHYRRIAFGLRLKWIPGAYEKYLRPRTDPPGTTRAWVGKAPDDVVPARAAGRYFLELGLDDDQLLRAVKLMLAIEGGKDRSAVNELDQILEDVGSGWRVDPDGTSLERRVPEPVRDAVEKTIEEEAPPSPAAGQGRTKQLRWDAFISHAHEDKVDVVTNLARELTERGLSIWYDEDVLEVGDSLRLAIDNGLSNSDFGIVVISRHFMRKDWTNRELDGILTRESGEKRLLPVWHGVEVGDVAKYSPTLAGRKAVNSALGVKEVANRLCRAMERGSGAT